ncbi:MAG: 5'/3'-nucleotidase SurE [Myxococcales bacterium]|nr:5'/3'-nucleotidase SurE [Myxococcales bacterium]
MPRPLALVTNDDGVDSYFLEVLVDALRDAFDLFVVAPAHEQSWSGRAFTRHGPIRAEQRTDRADPTWAVSGTPSDCVNLALGNLLPRPPDVVVSGINLGFNVSLILSLSSGTLAGAIEGAMWGLPAVALSQHLDPRRFDVLKRTQGREDPGTRSSVGWSARHAVGLVKTAIATHSPRPVVHSANFPMRVDGETPIEQTRLADLRLRGVFQPSGEGEYRFVFPQAALPTPVPEDSDLACIRRGHISVTRLDLADLGARIHHG